MAWATESCSSPARTCRSWAMASRTAAPRPSSRRRTTSLASQRPGRDAPRRPGRARRHPASRSGSPRRPRPGRRPSGRRGRRRCCRPRRRPSRAATSGRGTRRRRSRSVTISSATGVTMVARGVSQALMRTAAPSDAATAGIVCARRQTSGVATARLARTLAHQGPRVAETTTDSTAMATPRPRANRTSSRDGLGPDRSRQLVGRRGGRRLAQGPEGLPQLVEHARAPPARARARPLRRGRDEPPRPAARSPPRARPSGRGPPAGPGSARRAAQLPRRRAAARPARPAGPRGGGPDAARSASRAPTRAGPPTTSRKNTVSSSQWYSASIIWLTTTSAAVVAHTPAAASGRGSQAPATKPATSATRTIGPSTYQVQPLANASSGSAPAAPIRPIARLLRTTLGSLGARISPIVTPRSDDSLRADRRIVAA